MPWSIETIITWIFQILPYDLAILNNNNNYINNIIYYISLNKQEAINNNKIINTDNDLFFASSNTWDGNLIDTSHISSIGNVLYTVNNMWLILVSFILLIAMIGAIIITIKTSKSLS